MKRGKLRPFRGDQPLWIVILFMFIISILVVYSSTASMAYQKMGGDTSYYILRQVLYISVSLFAMFFMHWIDFRSYSRYTLLIFYFAAALVLFTIFLGDSRNEATRWISIPFFNSFQPSELLKVSLMALLAIQLGKRASYIDAIKLLPSIKLYRHKQGKEEALHIWHDATKPLLLPVLIAFAVIFPTNLSTALMIAGVSMIVFLIAGIRFQEVLRVVKYGALVIIIVVGIMYATNTGRANLWVGRVVNFVTIDASSQSDKNDKQSRQTDFQKEQAMKAIASGGVLGKGPGNSIQRTVLPLAHSDFAYALIIEEYGIWGAGLVFLLYLWLFYRSGVIVRRSSSATNAILVTGLCLSITIQAILNMMVCVGLLPITGQPLPLISMGGSSMFFTCVALGMILSVSRQNEVEALAEFKAQLTAELNDDFSNEEDTSQNIPLSETQLMDNSTDSTDDDRNESDDDKDASRSGSRRKSDRKSDRNDQEDGDDDFPFEIVDRGEERSPEEEEREVIDLY